MQQRHLNSIGIILFMVFLFAGCKKDTPVIKIEEAIIEEDKTPSSLSFDQVHSLLLPNIRLGDGVPLKLQISVRWKIDSILQFTQQFSSTDQYNNLIMRPRSLELASNISNDFESVDSVFYTHRQRYISEIKDELKDNLGEEGIQIKEIIMAEIMFPETYTKSMELAGLQQQELERINQKNISDIAQAEANRKKAEADAKVDIARAEAQARLQKIQAEAETSRRQSELARAETQAQVAQLQTQAEIRRQKLLAQAEIENKTELKNLEIQKKSDLNQLEIEKQEQLDRVDYDRQMKFAQLCSDQPLYASYLVNKQLASKVGIAVLPAGTDENVFSSVIKNVMPKLNQPTGFTPK